MKLRLLYLLPLALIAIPVVAQPPDRGAGADEREIARCIHRSARGKLWLEKALWGVRDQEGGWIGAEVRNRDGSYDLGPMQVNSWWVPRIGRLLVRSTKSVHLWLRDNACFNIEAARWILLWEFSRTHDIWTAIGSYHSPKQVQRRRYLFAVARKISAAEE